MSPPPKKAARPAEKPGKFAGSEPVPLPEVVEKDTDTAWAMFQALQEDPTRADFSETRRSGPGPLEVTPSFAATKPASLGAGSQAAAAGGPTLEMALAEARRNNRVCPLPPYWKRFYELLPNRTEQDPLPPVPATLWGSTPALNKRICLRSQIEWAHAHGGLAPIYAYLCALPEDKWHHMGD